MSTNAISCVVGSAEYAEASDQILLPLHKLAQTLVYNGDGTLNYVQVTNGAFNYRQQLTYNGSGQMTGVSIWTKQ